MGAPATKKRRVKGTRVERPRGVAAHFRQTDVSDVQEVWLGIHVALVASWLRGEACGFLVLVKLWFSSTGGGSLAYCLFAGF